MNLTLAKAKITLSNLWNSWIFESCIDSDYISIVTISRTVILLFCVILFSKTSVAVYTLNHSLTSVYICHSVFCWDPCELRGIRVILKSLSFQVENLDLSRNRHHDNALVIAILICESIFLNVLKYFLEFVFEHEMLK